LDLAVIVDQMQYIAWDRSYTVCLCVCTWDLGPNISKTAGDRLHARLWLHVTLHVKIVLIYLDGNILKSVRDGIGQSPRFW